MVLLKGCNRGSNPRRGVREALGLTNSAQVDKGAVPYVGILLGALYLNIFHLYPIT